MKQPNAIQLDTTATAAQRNGGQRPSAARKTGHFGDSICRILADILSQNPLNPTKLTMTKTKKSDSIPATAQAMNAKPNRWNRKTATALGLTAAIAALVTLSMLANNRTANVISYPRQIWSPIVEYVDCLLNDLDPYVAERAIVGV